MEVVEEKPLLLWDVIKLLEKRKGKRDKWEKTEQRRVYDYAKLIVKLPEDKARELYEKLIDELKIPEIVAVQIVDILPLTINEVEPFIKQLMERESIELTKEEEEKLIEEVKRRYFRAMYEPGEAIGIITAQSISEPATQMTMRTYHFAGTAGIQVTLGLPRVLEIFDARKEPRTPTMTIYLKPEYQKLEKVKEIAENIKEVKLKDVVDATTIDMLDMSVKCRLNLKKMREHGIEKEKLIKSVKMRNVEIELESNQLIARPKKKDIATLHKLKANLLEAHIKGIKGVSQVVVSKEGDEWVITTLGSNLKKAFEIEGVDFKRTTSNNIFEIQSVLGIEAARNAIIRQTQYTLEEQGLIVNPRYIMLLADLMTVSGEIRAIGRYGISGQKASVLVLSLIHI